ncbi:MAG: hypothetical protein Q8928_16195 [Bacteroidota bacterium]|nr:hypothetical protein [Bacteroidota bacterium]
MNEFEDIKPNFEGISKENPFQTPNNYFDNFTARMSGKISQQETLLHKPLWLTLPYQISTAVAFTCLAVLVYIGITNSFFNHKKLTPYEITEAYKYGALNDLDEAQLIQLVAKVESEKQSGQDSVKKNQEQYKKEIIDYLSKENIDINSIIDAL